MIRSVVALHNLINNKLALKEAENEGEKVCPSLQSSRDTVHSSSIAQVGLRKEMQNRQSPRPLPNAISSRIVICIAPTGEREREKHQLVCLVCPREQEKEDKDKEKREDDKEKKDGKDDKEKDKEKDKK